MKQIVTISSFKDFRGSYQAKDISSTRERKVSVALMLQTKGEACISPYLLFLNYWLENKKSLLILDGCS